MILSFHISKHNHQCNYRTFTVNVKETYFNNKKPAIFVSLIYNIAKCEGYKVETQMRYELCLLYSFAKFYELRQRLSILRVTMYSEQGKRLSKHIKTNILTL